jgi:DNA-directed RNA polymerase I, II, and III subunit RPABC2
MADDEGDFIGADEFEDGLEEYLAVEEELSEEAAEAAEQQQKAKDDPFTALLKHHPECVIDYSEEIYSKIPLTSSPSFLKDPNHRSVPFLTQYERTKILGMRANQLSQGARPYIVVPEYITDVLEIAKRELQERRLPYLIRRPMPDGTHEYWRLSDLLLLS